MSRFHCSRPAAAVAALGVSAGALAQTGVYSIDYQGPPIGGADACTGSAGLSEADILRPATGFPNPPGPGPGPCVFMSGGPGGLNIPLYTFTFGHPPGTTGGVEVDAMSFGDYRMQRPPAVPQYTWYFSVDEFARGFPISSVPSVITEGVVGNQEASADIFVDIGIGVGPQCLTGAPTLGNLDIVDGNGVAPFPGGFGLGLVEPNPPVFGVPDLGTNIDALDVDVFNLSGPVFPVWFSLDAGLVDAREGVTTGLAGPANGFSGADILIVPTANSAPAVYASAAQLGLDINGPNTDDIDALILWDNGDGVYQPPNAPYSWVNGSTDMVLFSLRTGSATLGQLDPLCGAPIEPCDLLLPSLSSPPATPIIFVPGEFLGLATVRSGTATTAQGSDDLDAADVTCRIPGDCDGNQVVDLIDLTTLLSSFGCCAPPACACDVDGDGCITLTDLTLLLAAFGATC